jgi:filamentous hemagglutinin family protein
MKSHLSGKRIQQWTLSLLLPAFAFTGGPAAANPRGGVVVPGSGLADITRVANQLRIHQRSQAVIINWQDFSIGRGEVTRFVQPTNGTALNRVVSGNVSEIHGQLKANANVYVVNPNGIVVGANGVIDVGGRAVLSTLDIDNDDFINGGANRFYGNSQTGVTNFGTVSSANGDVVLMGGFVDNQGQIGALNGTVAIGAGGDILLQEGAAGSKISVRGGSDYEGTGINNSGSIRGASAELKAHGNVYALAINNGGAIRANGADRRGGRVLLRASGSSSNINLGSRSSVAAAAGTDGGQVSVEAVGGSVAMAGRVEANGARSGGSVSVVGRTVEQAAGATVEATGNSVGGSIAIDASDSLSMSGSVRADSAFGTGGRVTLTGDTVRINDGAAVSSNGVTGGGTILVGGDIQGRDTGLREAESTRVEAGASLTADSIGGNGGRVVVWANGDTFFEGAVSAKATGTAGDGGFVEVSGKRDLYFDGAADVSSVAGNSGVVLFDPGDIIVGAGAGPGLITISSINNTLQTGANVLITTQSGNITFSSVGGGGDVNDGGEANNRHSAIQWTNSKSSFGALASGSIVVGNHIRTSGQGSINLLAGWSGSETDIILTKGPQAAWDSYVSQGAFGRNGGSVFVGFSAIARHVEVGSRFGDTNVAGYDISVTGSGTAANNRYAMIGFHDSGQVFAPRLNRGTDGGSTEIRLDMRVGSPSGTGAWLLSDGRNSTNMTPGQVTSNQVAAGVGDPIVAVVGNAFGQEVDLNGDGIADGVRGINSSGIVSDSFVPYANHYNSASSGNWWWQRIEAAGSLETKDPVGLGALRPEYGAGIGAASTVAKALVSQLDGADINVLAKGSVTVQGGSGNEAVAAMIGHGGPNRASTGGAGQSVRDVGAAANEDITNANFSISGIEANQMERRWSFNGGINDRTTTAIARLAPVYGNINVYGGIRDTAGTVVDHLAGKVTASVGTTGNVTVRAAQAFDSGAPSSNSVAQIGHGGIGQFGEYFGDIHVEAGGSIAIESGEATRSAATIGHTFTGHAFWNNTNVADQQLRFFATAVDFDNPNLRRGELFSGVASTGFNPATDPAAALRRNLANFPDNGTAAGYAINTTLGYSVNQYTRALGGGNANQGTANLGSIDLAPTAAPGGIVVPALDGSVLSGFHGDVMVIARTGDIALKSYQTEGAPANVARDRRFTAIGHGGSNFGHDVVGSGYQNLVGTPGTPGNDGRDIVNYHMPNGTGLETGSRAEYGTAGTNVVRYLTFMSISGDIDVQAGRDFSMQAGNDIFDYSRVGHGGAELADFETSSFVLGDIRVRAGGDVSVIGGGSVQPTSRNGNYDVTAWAQIGHGGVRTGFLGYLGDIDVSAGGNLLVRNGAFTSTFAKIGHQALDDRGQSGGLFSRVEDFRFDGARTSITSLVNSTAASVTYASVNGDPGSVTGVRDIAARGAGNLVNADLASANINVRAGGSVTLDHMQGGVRQPVGKGDADPTLANNPTLGVRTGNSYAMIGHGGITTIAYNPNNTATNYQNKHADISVTAGGDVTLRNGEGLNRWSRIGHGVGRNERVDDAAQPLPGYSRAIELAGDISVTAGGDISINAAAASSNERIENSSALYPQGDPSEFNPVVIGHGGIDNNLDLVVLGSGELVNGLPASSNIDARAGRDLLVLGGNGSDISFAQLGHGFASDQGNDESRRLGLPTGFTGNISARVGRDLLVQGGQKAWIETSGSISGTGRSVVGAFALIGNGGFQIDAPSKGDISVFVGRDARVVAQQRTDVATTTAGIFVYSPITNPDTGAIGSAFNFAKIGHVSVENGARLNTTADAVFNANQSGDITVVVQQDLTIQGGITPDVDTQTIYGAFAQIGHGGPAITGNLDGDITVLAQRNLVVLRGSEIGGTAVTTRALNNYAMIGNGDFLRDVDSSNGATLFRQVARGTRTGDIDIAAGQFATFSGAMVGHLDPALLFQETTGDTRIAVSRSNPFYGGRGVLTASNGTVFTSGNFGVGSRMEFYMPTRTNNNLDSTTRINEAVVTFATAPDDFRAPFNKANGALAGRADEVYLTPDLWWDQTGQGAALGISGGGLFPTDASGSHGGAIATVNTPGGLPGLVSLTPGTLGSSASIYRDQNGVSGSGLYTLYYDAIEESLLPPVVPVVPPVAPGVTPPAIVFDFFGLPFTETYDAFFREDELFNGVAGDGSWLYPLLGLFERDETLVEESADWRPENALDNLFGDRRDSNSQEEQDEERASRIARGQLGGPVGMSFYLFEPGTNRYSSYRVFGYQVGTFIPGE